MRYLKYRHQFLTNEISKIDNNPINESFENDITFGGSLLGRLINSTIRKAKVSYNSTKVNNIVKQVKGQLNTLLRECLEDEEKRKLAELVYKFLLEQIYKQVESNEEVNIRINYLIGDEDESNSGLVNKAIDEIEKSQILGKDEILEKLEKFKEELSKIKRTKVSTKDEDEDEEDEKDKDEKESEKQKLDEEYEHCKKMLQNLCKIVDGIMKWQELRSGEKVSTKNGGNNSKDIQISRRDIQNRNNSLSKKSNTPNGKLIGQGNSLEKGSKTVSTKALPSSKKELPYSDNKPVPYKSNNRQLSQGQKQLSNSTDKDVIPHEEIGESPSNSKNLKSAVEKAWNKLLEAYKSSGIGKFINLIKELLKNDDKNNIIKIGRKVIENKSSIGKPISYHELISESVDVQDISKSISLFSRVLLGFSDKGSRKEILQMYKVFTEGSIPIGNYIKEFITSFIKLNRANKPKNESISNYLNFLLISEADDFNMEKDDSEEDDDNKDDNVSDKKSENSDDIKSIWYKIFRRGEERKWKVNHKDAKQLQEELEKKEFTIDYRSNIDPIIKIVNLFERAYHLYSTDYIPSGRPGGRISQKTLREYEFIGKGSPSGNPLEGNVMGPWAVKKVYDKWENGITKILEDPALRKIFANAKFVSRAESETPGSGKTLFKFINDLLHNEEGDFKRHRHAIFNTYFGIDDKKEYKDEFSSSSSQKLIKPIAKDDHGETDKPFFSIGSVSLRNESLKLRNLDKILRITTEKNCYIIYPYKYNEDEEYVLFRMQVSSSDRNLESIITRYLKNIKSDSGEEFRTDLLKEPGTPNVNPIEFKDDLEVYVAGVDMKDASSSFYINGEFKFKFTPISDVINDKYNVKSATIKIKKIESLVVPFKDKKGKQMVKDIQFKNISIRPKKDCNMGTSNNIKVIKEFKK